VAWLIPFLLVTPFHSCDRWVVKVRLLAFGGFEEEVVGRVRHQGLVANVYWLAHPVEGAIPPEVFSRWMKVVLVSLWPPVGPS
jgi:hypothetical protein